MASWKGMRAGWWIMIGVLATTPVMARDALGAFGSWAAFRDARPSRCFAIAEPEKRGSGSRRPFASIATWPATGVRSQLHVRLRRDRSADTPVELAIGASRFTLVAGRADAWAPDRRIDAAIVAAMRSGSWMRITARDDGGSTFSDSYALSGAATAIDATMVACARLR